MYFGHIISQMALYELGPFLNTVSLLIINRYFLKFKQVETGISLDAYLFYKFFLFL